MKVLLIKSKPTEDLKFMVTSAIIQLVLTMQSQWLLLFYYDICMLEEREKESERKEKKE